MKRALLVVLILAALPPAVAIASLLMEPRYVGIAGIRFDTPASSTRVGLPDGIKEDPAPSGTYSPHPEVAEQVASTLGLASPEGVTEAVELREATAASGIWEIEATADSAELAAQMAIAIAHSYVRLNKQLLRAQAFQSQERARLRLLLSSGSEDRRRNLPPLGTGTQINDLTVVSEATAPSTPDSPRPVRNTIVALILVLLALIALVAWLRLGARRRDAQDRNKPVRILRVIARLNVGGPAHHVSLLSGLDGPRWETLLVHGRTGPGEEALTDPADRLGARRRELAVLGPRIRPFADVRAVAELVMLIREYRPQVIHTHTAKAGLIGRLAAAIVSPRDTVVVHTYHGHVLEGYFGRAKSLLYRGLERILAARCDVLIGVSTATVDDLVRLRIAPRDRFRIIRLGLDLAPFAAEDDEAGQEVRHAAAVPARPEAVLATFVGRFVPIKRIDALLHAFAKARQSAPQLFLLVVGDGKERARLEELARGLAIDHAVRFTGYRRDMVDVAAATDFAVLASRTEGTPVALIEAAAAGRPAVATRVGGVAEVVEDGTTGLLVPAADVDAFAGALVRLANESRLRREMGRRAREKVFREFSAERLLSDIDALYRELVARARSRSARDRRLRRARAAAAALGVLIASGAALAVAAGDERQRPSLTVPGSAQKEPPAQDTRAKRSFRGDETLILEQAFTRKVPAGIDLKYPPIRTFKEFRRQVDRLYIPVEDFYDAGPQIELLGRETHGEVVQVDALLEGRPIAAHAYRYRPGRRARRCAALVIPSGIENSSTQIMRNEGDYGNTARELGTRCDVFVYIKPNEDYLAFHDGTRREANFDFIYDTLLSRGGSYHVTYMVEAMAFLRQLHNEYDLTGVVGLSQGGEAAHLIAPGGAPDFAVVASGFSLYQRQLTWSGYSQIVVPGLYNRLPTSEVKRRMIDSQTRYLLTYGAQDTAVYQTDARTGKTCRWFNRPAFGRRIAGRCLVHTGGHAVPHPEVLKFIDRIRDE